MSKLFIAALMVGMAGGVWAQDSAIIISDKPGCTHYGPNDKHLPNVPECKPAPLKCGKYEHVETVPDKNYVGWGMHAVKDACKPDMHSVTEKEWQELMARLGKLEAPRKSTSSIASGDGSGITATATMTGWADDPQKPTRPEGKPIPAKPWVPKMCEDMRNSLTSEYVSYCAKQELFPACDPRWNDPREAMWVSQSNGGHGAYFEVLDCSWHSGHKPRDAK